MPAIILALIIFGILLGLSIWECSRFLRQWHQFPQQLLAQDFSQAGLWQPLLVNFGKQAQAASHFYRRQQLSGAFLILTWLDLVNNVLGAIGGSILAGLLFGISGANGYVVTMGSLIGVNVIVFSCALILAKPEQAGWSLHQRGHLFWQLAQRRWSLRHSTLTNNFYLRSKLNVLCQLLQYALFLPTPVLLHLQQKLLLQHFAERIAYLTTVLQEPAILSCLTIYREDNSSKVQVQVPLQKTVDQTLSCLLTNFNAVLQQALQLPATVQQLKRQHSWRWRLHRKFKQLKSQ